MRGSKIVGSVASAAAISVALTLCGCAATVTSSPLPGCSNAHCPAAAGFVYSLPRGQYYLQASRLPVTTADVATAATALAAANAVVKKDQSSIADATTTLATDTGKKASADTLAADQAALDGLKVGLQADVALLNQAQDAFNRAQAGLGKGTETYSISPLQIVPDPAARFSATLNHLVSRDDAVKIDGAGGLLTSATTSSTDQSLNTVVSLLQTGITLASFASTGIPIVPPPGPRAAPAAGPPPPFPLSCTYQLAENFDPLDPTDVTRVNAELAANHATIRLDVRVPTDTPAQATYPSMAVEATSSTPQSGLFYRTATTAVVTIRPVAGADQDSAIHTAWTSADSMWVAGGPSLDIASATPTNCPLIAKPLALSQLSVLPDSRTVFRVDADAGIFTVSTHSYIFVNGMLTEHQESRPSELVAPVQALNTLAQAVVAIPGSIVQMRLNFTNSSDQLVKAQTTLYSDRLAFLSSAYNAKAAVDNAQAAFVTAQFATPEAYMAAQTNLINASQALQKLINNVAPPGNAPAPLPAAVTPQTSPKPAF